ncbi:Transient receptor protein 2 [Intoshia linei]|uniref:Transient receptor protein 2 n=1 Tax=Intoshia linei TaxID=1819745 RepID=A0A177BCP7_9BILA|nr:Transient receptor protein 2 [Intoshia linei]
MNKYEKKHSDFMDEIGLGFNDDSHHDKNNKSLGKRVVRKEASLKDNERLFLIAIERGDIASVEEILNNVDLLNVDINCVDMLGRNGLIISIENENLEIMNMLLNCNIIVGDGLLHAINEENILAVEVLLPRSPPVNETIISDSFTPDITPIILAAHKDNYEIIKILLDHGYIINQPHQVKCFCDECVMARKTDSLNLSRSRINAFSALSSPSLISLTSKDPILSAFEISCDLKALSKLENEFCIKYENLADQCRNYAVSLLDQTRNSDELSTILNHDAEHSYLDDDTFLKNDPNSESIDTSHMTLERLKLAIKYKQKKFVSHANCQQVLSTMWYEGLPGFRRMPFFKKIFIAMLICFLYPIMSMICIITPNSKIGLLMRRPFIKFICNTASYLTFLFLLVLKSQRIDTVNWFGYDPTYQIKLQLRGMPLTYLEWTILLWVLGLMFSEFLHLWSRGAKEYMTDMWNMLDFVTLSLYVATFTLKIISYYQVEYEKSKQLQAAFIPRELWDAFDPDLISEGLFSVANIFSCLKLVSIFTINPHLGPLQISLGRMIYDILRFMCIAVLVVFSYACGVNQLYWYYADRRSIDCDACTFNCLQDGVQCKDDECDGLCNKALSNLFEILQSLYFVVYALIDVRRFEIKEPHDFTQFIGKLMFGTYSAIIIIVLLNMLIAMLSNSFQKISNDADTEWKFARSQLWISYFDKDISVPVPLNLVPIPYNLFKRAKKIFHQIWSYSKNERDEKWKRIKHNIRIINEKEEKYQKVVLRLINRYAMQKSKDLQNQGVTEDDLNEIKQDISLMKYDLIDLFKINNFDTGNVMDRSSGKITSKGSRLSLQRMERDISKERLISLHNRMGNEKINIKSENIKSLGNQIKNEIIQGMFQYRKTNSSIKRRQSVVSTEDKNRKNKRKMFKRAIKGVIPKNSLNIQKSIEEKCESHSSNE